MRFRKLRIAWSVAWGVVAVLLCVLWVRSYWWWDSTTFIPDHSLATKEGRLLWDTPLAAIPKPWKTLPAAPQPRFGVLSQRLDHIIIMPIDERVGIYGGRARSVPIWGAMLVAVGLGAVVWCPRRFSLRTMLVATALVAVALGVAVSWFK